MCIFTINSIAQSVAKQSFQLSGTIDADTGSMELMFVADSTYYPKGFNPAKAKIINNQFSFEGKLSHPVGVQLLHSSNRYYSAMFMIEPGIQTIAALIDSNKKIPVVHNGIMQEYYNEYKPRYTESNKMNARLIFLNDSLNNKFGSGKWPDAEKLQYAKLTKAMYAEDDKILLAYIRSHPSSYLSLWKIVQLLHYGYEPAFDDMYAALSASIKATQTGLELGEKLKSNGSMMAIGKHAAIFKCVNMAGSAMPVNIYTKNKYTLVDFWYSNCAPCIGQFPDLKKVYIKYRASGFEIAGISTDKLKAEKNWLYQIKRNELPWLQYWDKNGIEAIAYNVLRFPTNILVNKEGIIVAKDINPQELAEFLQSNLKQ